jgi:hypothetical protein
MNRFKVKSNSSDSIYIIAQNASGRFWGCSCRGYTTRPEVRNCAHLKALNIPGGGKAYEIRIDSGGAPTIASATAVSEAMLSKSSEEKKTGLGRRKINLD